MTVACFMILVVRKTCSSKNPLFRWRTYRWFIWYEFEGHQQVLIFFVLAYNTIRLFDVVTHPEDLKSIDSASISPRIKFLLQQKLFSQIFWRSIVAKILNRSEKYPKAAHLTPQYLLLLDVGPSYLDWRFRTPDSNHLLKTNIQKCSFY